MLIELRLPELLSEKPFMGIYDPELDDITSILSDVCGRLEKDCEFVVSGFGQKRWPVDVGTDLAVFLEQLPELIRAIESDSAGEMDFYEQGIEKKLTFTPLGNRYDVTCTNLTTSTPNPECEQVDRKALLNMLSAVRDTFLQLLNRLAPSLVKHPFVLAWLNRE